MRVRTALLFYLSPVLGLLALVSLFGIVKLFPLLDELSPQKTQKEPFVMYFLQK
jgi:hypothetical protein